MLRFVAVPWWMLVKSRHDTTPRCQKSVLFSLYKYGRGPAGGQCSRWLIGVTLSHFVERAHRLLGPQKVKDEVRGFHFGRKLRISGFLFSDDDRGGDKLFLRHKLTVLLIYTFAGEDHTLSLNQLKDTIL